VAYISEGTKVQRLVVWNPLATPPTVSFYEGNDTALDQMIAAPQAVTSVTKLSPAP
jgi:hypothetical protein